MPTEHYSQSYKWWVMGIVMIGTFMSILDSSIVNVAVPHIMAHFGVSLDESKWVITGYMLGYAVLMPISGWARDALGIKTTFVWALVIFTAGSALCGMAWSNDSLVLARVIQAIGGGAIMPTGMTMITEVFEPHERGLAIGIWGVGAIVAPAIGPTLGGLMVDSLGWRSIFYVNVPVGIVAVVIARAILIEGDRKYRPFDFVGYFFLATFLISSLLLLSEGQTEGWMSTFALANAVITLAAFALFLASAYTSEHPILDLHLFRIRNFSIATGLGIFRSVGLFGSTFLLPIFMQNFMGYTATRSGLALMPGAIIIGMIMPVAGRLSDRIGPKILAIGGVLATALFLYMMRDLKATSQYSEIFWPLVIRGIGVGFLMAPITAAAMNAVPREKLGMASGMLNLVQQVGGAAGIAYVEMLVQRRTIYHAQRLGEAAGRSPIAHGIAMKLQGLASSAEAGAAKSQAILGLLAKRLAAVSAFDDAFVATAVIVLVGVIPAFFLVNVKPAGGTPKDVQAMSHGE